MKKSEILKLFESLIEDMCNDVEENTSVVNSLSISEKDIQRYLLNYIGKYVVVSTDENKRGVFFGKLKKFDGDKKVAILEECQMAVYWSAETRGFNNLAVIGPQKKSRITQPTTEQYLDGVSCIILATDIAKAQWKKCEWES